MSANQAELNRINRTGSNYVELMGSLCPQLHTQIESYLLYNNPLYPKAADMGDAESYFYLALLQSTGLHGEEPGGGQAQARTWALCGADAFNTNAYLLLA